MREQRGWNEHFKFMDALEEEQFVVLGGPLGNYPKHRAMLIINAQMNKHYTRSSLMIHGCVMECFAPFKSTPWKFSWESH